MVLEEITNHYQYDNRVSVMQNLDDIGQPYDCEGWANFNDTDSFNIIDVDWDNIDTNTTDCLILGT